MGFRSTNHDYIYFAGRRIARYDSSGAVYYLYDDANGSLRTMTDASGNQLCWADYYPFGEPVSGTGCSGDNYQYAGLYSDAAGEDGGHSATHRRYNDTYYRWFSPDPAGQKAVNLSNPQTWNMYAYVADNPATLSDPSGLLPPGPPGAGDGDGCSAQNAPGDCPKAQRQNTVTVRHYHLVVTKNAGGTESVVQTITDATFSTAKGSEGKFLGAATQTNTYGVTAGQEVINYHAGAVQQIGYGQAVHAMGAGAIEDGVADAFPSFAGQFARAVGQDIAAHPLEYGVHVLGFALPYLGIPSEVEGLYTAAEALREASKLEKMCAGGGCE